VTITKAKHQRYSRTAAPRICNPGPKTRRIGAQERKISLGQRDNDRRDIFSDTHGLEHRKAEVSLQIFSNVSNISEARQHNRPLVRVMV
jgi:hypothetical protein